mgnify:CR=1 FL=1
MTPEQFEKHMAVQMAILDRLDKILGLRMHIPAPDAVYKTLKSGQPARAWKLSTIRAWNPAIAARCQRLIHDPEPLPPMAA